MAEDGSVVTVEGEMERLSLVGWFAVEVEIVNAGHAGAQFFAAQIRDHGWAAFRKPIRTLHGYGSGDTVLDALAAVEQTAMAHSAEYRERAEQIAALNPPNNGADSTPDGEVSQP